MGFVVNLSLFVEVKELANRSRIDKVIAMARVAAFFETPCIYWYCNSVISRSLPVVNDVLMCYLIPHQAATCSN